MAAVLRALGLEDAGPTEIVRALRLSKPENATKKITRWREGGSAPNYEATMALLVKAGWLTEDAWALLRAAEAEAQKAEATARRFADRPPTQGKQQTG